VRSLITSVRLFLILTVLTGVLYPLIMAGIAQSFFKNQATGSMISFHGKVIGSQLIGQNMTDNRYFWPRPSAIGYNPMRSGASHLSLSGKQFQAIVDARVIAFAPANGVKPHDVPPEMYNASASGLDPDISPEAAFEQVERIAKARGWGSAEIEKARSTIVQWTQKPLWGFLGPRRMNVLSLNKALLTLP